MGEKQIPKGLARIVAILKQFSIGLLITTSALAAPPDLTQSGIIAGINHSETYNLGATGLRGWIAIDSKPRAMSD